MTYTNVYFVRHAESDHTIQNDVIRPLTSKGLLDAMKVAQTLKNKNISLIYSSPYKRTIDTIKPLSNELGIIIIAIDDFRERKIGAWVEDFNAFSKNQWADFSYKLEDGESLQEVQERNIAALLDIIQEFQGENIVIGTHGTALSTIINFYNPEFGYESFWSIIDKMPYMIHFRFNDQQFINMVEMELD